MEGMRITRQSSKGTCSCCNGSFAKSAMSRHLKACQARRDENDGQAEKDSGKMIFHLQVEGLYSFVGLPAGVYDVEVTDYHR